MARSRCVIFCAVLAPLTEALLRATGPGGYHSPPTATATGAAKEESCEAVSRFMLGEGSCVHSNLGGHGPDAGGEQSMVFANVFPFFSDQIDMRIKVVDGQYEPFNVSHNGERGFFMSINVKCGTTAVLDFDLVDAKTGEPRSAPYEWMFTIFDFDSEGGDKGRESVSIRGFDEVIRTPTTRVAEGEDGIFTKFTATREGEIEDNPTAPWNMTTFQLDDTVTLLYAPRFELRMKLSATECETGRNFEFSGTTGLGCPWQEKCSNYQCPSEKVIRGTEGGGADSSDGLFCKRDTCGDEDEDTCCVTTTTTTTTMDQCSEAGMLTLTNVKSANLGGQGPDTNEEEAIIYDNVFPMLHHKLDLAILVGQDSSYTPSNISRNAVIGDMYQLNFMMGTETKLKFEFRHRGTKVPAQAPPFLFTVADIDQRRLGGGVESIKLSNWESKHLSQDTTLVFDEDSKSFTSSEYGELDDNPSKHDDSLNLPFEDRQKAVTFKMPKLYNFVLQVTVGEREECQGTCNDQDTGRNVFIAAASNIVCSDGGSQ